MLGRRYVIDHAVAFYNERQKAEIYRIYTTDALKVITENTAHFAGGGVLNTRYHDILNPPPKMSADAVKEKIKAKFRR